MANIGSNLGTLSMYLEKFPFDKGDGNLVFRYFRRIVPDATSLTFYNFNIWLKNGIENHDNSIIQLIEDKSDFIEKNNDLLELAWEREQNNSTLLVPSLKSLKKKVGMFQNEVD